MRTVSDLYIYYHLRKEFLLSQSVFICFSVLFLQSCKITDPEEAEHNIAHAKHSFSTRSTWKTVSLLLSNHCLTHWFELNICMYPWNGIHNSQYCIKSGQGVAQWLYALLSPYCMHFCENLYQLCMPYWKFSLRLLYQILWVNLMIISYLIVFN